jgi:hypothetical protein
VRAGGERPNGGAGSGACSLEIVAHNEALRAGKKRGTENGKKCHEKTAATKERANNRAMHKEMLTFWRRMSILQASVTGRNRYEKSNPSKSHALRSVVSVQFASAL